MIADPDATVIESYGVRHESLPIAARRTFVIGRDGRIVASYDQASARGHAEQVVVDVRNLLDR